MVPLEVLRAVKAIASIVLATDNMDCFADTFTRVRRARRPRGLPAAVTLAQWALVCVDIICSSDVAALKSEDPIAFFGPWLRRHGMAFHDALLIDDRADNCTAFRQQGGTALRWRMGTNDIIEVANTLNRWLDSPAIRIPPSLPS
ncbi:hypothetical protein [Nonomuraea roseola]|uniref:HAD family hydrolase n=1 Tax=Nonomuraea roseola TaxID=46179 RepID=A0ABV5Q2N6_9ACTN